MTRPAHRTPEPSIAPGPDTPPPDATAPPDAAPVVDDTDTPTDTPESTDSRDGAADHPRDAREAARYRRALREVEADRDGLRTQVQAMHRAEVDRLAAVHLATPGGIWAGGADLADVLGPDGAVDPDKVRGLAEHVADTYGVQRRALGLYVPREGSNPRPARRRSMEDVIRGH